MVVVLCVMLKRVLREGCSHTGLFVKPLLQPGSVRCSDWCDSIGGFNWFRWWADPQRERCIVQAMKHTPHIPMPMHTHTHAHTDTHTHKLSENNSDLSKGVFSVVGNSKLCISVFHTLKMWDSLHFYLIYIYILFPLKQNTVFPHLKFQNIPHIKVCMFYVCDAYILGLPVLAIWLVI